MTTIRLFVFNFAGACFVAWAWWLGYVRQVFANDISHISYVIAALFVGALIVLAVSIWRSRPVEWLTDVSEWLVTLGLIGNVVGFVIALSGVSTADVGSAEGAQKIAQELLSGMGVAFYSTLVGAVTALWLSVNRRILG